jgi:23S rRNA (adenine2030-N6)-methyltransferase
MAAWPAHGSYRLNYRHIYHAGNFADLVKHAILLQVLGRLQARSGSLQVIDTHAGAGVYDLDSAEARKSEEAAAGVARLMADAEAPEVFAPLKAAVWKLNPSGGLHRYPGSPWLVAQALRPADRLIACELRPDEFGALQRTLTRPQEVALFDDGYRIAQARVRPDAGALVLVDPPYERADDYAQAQACARAVLQRSPSATVLIWAPLKDLETFDGLLRGLEGPGGPPVLVAEARLRPLSDPMRLNGCALVVVNDPPGTEEGAFAVCDWAVRRLGEPGGEARVWRL